MSVGVGDIRVCVANRWGDGPLVSISPSCKWTPCPGGYIAPKRGNLALPRPIGCTVMEHAHHTRCRLCAVGLCCVGKCVRGGGRVGNGYAVSGLRVRGICIHPERWNAMVISVRSSVSLTLHHIVHRWLIITRFYTMQSPFGYIPCYGIYPNIIYNVNTDSVCPL